MVPEFEQAVSNICKSLESKIGQNVKFERLESKPEQELLIDSHTQLSEDSRKYAVIGHGTIQGYLIWKNALETQHYMAIKAAGAIIGNALCYYTEKSEMDHKWSENNERLEHLNKIRKEDKNDDQEETKDRDKVPTVKDIVEKFCDRFEEIRRKPEADKWISHGAQDSFKLRIQKFVSENKPIYVIVPSFPYKSKNKMDKTLSDYPDMTEFLSIKKLTDWCRSIDTFYPPGVRIIIFSDGRFYNDHFGIPDDCVTKYQKAVEKMHPSKYIKWLHLDDFLPEEQFDHTQKRAGLDALYGVTMDYVEKLVKEDENVQLVYTGFKFWIQEELGGFPDNIKSTNAKRKFCSKFAKEMLKRNQVYSKYLNDLFPDVIRLSIHAHNNTQKIGIHLFGDDNTSCGTPWHNVAALRLTGKWEFMKKKEAEMMKFKLRGKEFTEAENDDYLHYVEE